MEIFHNGRKLPREMAQGYLQCLQYLHKEDRCLAYWDEASPSKVPPEAVQKVPLFGGGVER